MLTFSKLFFMRTKRNFKPLNSIAFFCSMLYNLALIYTYFTYITIEIPFRVGFITDILASNEDSINYMNRLFMSLSPVLLFICFN